jgi:hypothetical protein
MEIIYTLHARMRMLERMITEKEVEFILKNPDFVDDGRDKTLTASKIIGDKIIKIIYRLQGNKIIEITVY